MEHTTEQAQYSKNQNNSTAAKPTNNTQSTQKDRSFRLLSMRSLFKLTLEWFKKNSLSDLFNGCHTVLLQSFAFQIRENTNTQINFSHCFSLELCFLNTNRLNVNSFFLF